MERKHRAKSVTGWLGAACVLALASVCISPCKLVAQATTSSDTSPSKKTGTTKAANPKKSAKPAAGATSTSAKAHAASNPAATQHSKSNTTLAARNSKSTHASSRASARKNGKKKTTARGQRKIEPERAQAIQEALIREHYLSGEPAGTWNQASEDAMRRYQADHGWQSKEVPDSRALISLGLGPSHDHLLNPESAMTTGPDVSHASSVNSATQSPVSHSADPGARMNTNPTAPADPASVPASDRNPSGPQ